MEQGGVGRENAFDAKKFPDLNMIAFVFFGYTLRSFKNNQNSLQTCQNMTHESFLLLLQKTPTNPAFDLSRSPMFYWKKIESAHCLLHSPPPLELNNRELTQPRRRRQQESHKFAYLIVKNNSFARFARAVFIFDISLMFSFFLRREMTCFAVVWTTWPYDDKCSILSSYLRSTGSNLIPG